jgi:hypothetical protein
MPTLGPLNIRALAIFLGYAIFLEFDGSVYPKKLIQMFEYLPVLLPH